ncbi:uncharacterized protein BO80DRAFT_159445 [Aspergillus ibericus CBS 121593]|uniref:Uncharacterized protein n=1 Tax=Aspergillus ibericus CBS 121593 TaxID=1448316 RepID=A0A395GSE8_9EURO|nr:hypothetical protein BO80DRAFT_159445 [Aspergillus ibericus CBS 121593]RAK98336.1 hypothetical protein BO80DRAFT_159445 [Aspergillus ibericus CBS 121593]
MHMGWVNARDKFRLGIILMSYIVLTRITTPVARDSNMTYTTWMICFRQIPSGRAWSRAVAGDRIRHVNGRSSAGPIAWCRCYFVFYEGHVWKI